MSGYTGNPDAESEHALIIPENAIHIAREMLTGRVLEYCRDCGDLIPIARRKFAIAKNMKCEYCVTCQPNHDKAPRIKMLDRIL